MSESSELPVLSGSPALVVDSWPVLEWIYRKEPAMVEFRSRLEAAERGDLRLFISRINYAEIKYNVEIKKRQGLFFGIEVDISSLPWTVVSVDDDLVDEATKQKGRYPISFADCFAVALAQRLGARVISGDPDFKRRAERGVVAVDWVGA